MSTVPFNRPKKYPLPPDITKKLPYNADTERAILGSVLLDNSVLKVIREELEAADFNLPQNQVIFLCMAALADSQKPIDLLTITDELHRTSQLDRAGGAAYVSSLADGVPKASNVKYYVEAVREDSRRRMMIKECYRIEQLAYEDGTKADALWSEVDRLLKQSQQPAKNKLVTVDCQKLLMMDLRPIEFVIEPILPVKGIGMLYAWRGVGKTYVTLELAYCVATGTPKCFVWNIPEKRRVIYVDGEMDVESLQDRLREIVRGHDMAIPEENFFQFITPDLQANFQPKINTHEGQAAIESHLLPGDLLILDNLSALSPCSNEDETGDWVMVQAWLLKLRRLGITTLFMHHAGKSGSQRGFSGREDLINVTVNLRRPEGYQVEDQLRAEVHLEKIRGKSAVGEWVQPFEIQLTTENGGALWLQRPLKHIIEKKAFQMMAAGMKPNDIAQDLRLSRYQVYRLKQKFDNGSPVEI